MHCRICEAPNHQPRLVVPEMMYGSRECFDYVLCHQCGCLQIADTPADLNRHYPENYYSFAGVAEHGVVQPSGLRRTLSRWRVQGALFDRGHKQARLAGKVVDLPKEIHAYGSLLRKASVSSFETRFLDVGCGSHSWWLNVLRRLGFERLRGVDPHIATDTDDGCVQIKKGTIDQVDGEFDLITFHHSLEHIPQQHETLRAARKLLAPGGVVLLRIPVVPSAVWDDYGVDWVELDAPRHLYLHSLQSLELLAGKCGFKVDHVSYDSTAFEFWGSEQYRRGIALTAPESLANGAGNSNFTLAEMRAFELRAEAANAAGTGGRACFFLRAA